MKEVKVSLTGRPTLELASWYKAWLEEHRKKDKETAVRPYLSKEVIKKFLEEQLV